MERKQGDGKRENWERGRERDQNKRVNEKMRVSERMRERKNRLDVLVQHRFHALLYGP